MCVIESKRYVYADGQRTEYETLRPCERSDGKNPCSTAIVEDIGDYHIREARPSPTASRFPPTPPAHVEVHQDYPQPQGRRGSRDNGRPRRNFFRGAEIVLHIGSSRRKKKQRSHSEDQSESSSMSGAAESSRQGPRPTSFPGAPDLRSDLQHSNTARYNYPPPPPAAVQVVVPGVTAHSSPVVASSMTAGESRSSRPTVVINDPRYPAPSSLPVPQATTSHFRNLDEVPQRQNTVRFAFESGPTAPLSPPSSPRMQDDEIMSRAATRERLRAESLAAHNQRRMEEENERLARIELERFSFRETQRQQQRESQQRGERERQRSPHRQGESAREKSKRKAKVKITTEDRSSSSSSSTIRLSPSQEADIAATQVQMGRERAAAEARERAEALAQEESRRASRQERTAEEVRNAEAQVRFLRNQVDSGTGRERRRPRSIESTAHQTNEYFDLPIPRRRPVSFGLLGGRPSPETLRERGERVIAAERERAREREYRTRMVTDREWDDSGARLPAGTSLWRSGSVTGAREPSYAWDRRRWHFWN